MTAWEQARKDVETLSDTFHKTIKDMADYIRSMVNECVAMVAAYNRAKKEHPEWVHKANYSKKKRTRKKYHDRIMQQYWRA